MKIALCFMAAAVMSCLLASGKKGENAVTLYKGLGAWHHPIATKNSQTQKYFDQGLMLVYSFNRYEALRSFVKASELDPAAVMPFWGIAMAQGPYVNMDGDASFNLKAACAAAHAGSRLANVPESERAYLRVVLSWCPEYRPDSYVEAARRLASDYPNDLDAQVLFADSLLTRVRWHWYDKKGNPALGVTEAEGVLQDVMRRWPQHPGANHLYIHAVESSPSPERGIASAQRLMGIVPWAGHMVHMPAHIWLLFGDWEAAASINERAAAVDQDYFDVSAVKGGSYELYYLHNLHFVLYARTMQGNKAQSLLAAAKLQSASAMMQHAMPAMADSFGAFSILAYVRFEEWVTILQMSEPLETLPASRSAWKFARTLAFEGLGNTIAAQREHEQFKRQRQALGPNVLWGQNNTFQDVTRLASEILSARLSSGFSEQCAHWQSAVHIQDELVYDEPPPWYYPVRESLGSCLLKAGRLVEAVKVFQDGVRRSPRNGRMLFGLKESLRAQGKYLESQSVEQEFRAAWSRADFVLRIEDM